MEDNSEERTAEERVGGDRRVGADRRHDRWEQVSGRTRRARVLIFVGAALAIGVGALVAHQDSKGDAAPASTAAAR